MSILKVLFSFSGRISRSQYWLGALVPFLIFAIMFAGVFSGLVHLFKSGQSSPIEIIAGLGKMILPVTFGVLLSTWITAALYTKRLHDRGKGAIWLLAIYIPALLPLISMFYFQDGALIISLISLVAGLWTFVELGCLGSKEGPNRFDNDTPTKKVKTEGNNWDAPQSGGQSPNLGGMAAAMAAMNVAARENQNLVKSAQRQPASGPQFGHQAPAQFGRLNAGATPGGFGRRV